MCCHYLPEVCPGGHLMLSCCANGSSLQWIVNVSISPLHLEPGETGIRFITRTSPESEPPIIANQTVFHVSKTSNSPLTSIVSVDNVTSDLNQTRIECSRVSITTIHVVGNDGKIKLTLNFYVLQPLN